MTATTAALPGERPAARPDAILEAVGTAAHRFLTYRSPWEQSALEVLGVLGRAAGASRAYLFENDEGADGELRTRQRFQWTSPDAPPQDGNPTAVDFAFRDIGLQRWEAILGAGEPVHGRTRDLPLGEQQELVIEGIRSIAIVPVMVDGRWWGFVGFDECASERPWTPPELDALRVAAGLFAAVVSRQQTADQRVRQQRLLEQRVAALARIASALTGGCCLRDKLRILAQSVVEATAAFGCSVSMVSSDPVELLTVESHGLPDGHADAHRAVWDAGSQEETQRALQLREPVVLPSLTDELGRDARYAPLRAVLGEAADGALVVLPLLSGDTALGIVHVYYRRPGPVHHDELAFLTAIADHGAIACEHARLLEEAARSTLLEERQRLSRELHDSVSQAVYGIALGARTARALLDRDPSKVAEPLDYVLNLAEAGLAEMRALIFELRPESLQREGLVAALDKQAQALQARHELTVDATLSAEPDLPLDRKEAIYRIGQEALHNIAKHARATSVRVSLTCDDDVVQLEVSDDGVGFDAVADFPGHLGMLTMRERAEAIGGTLDLRSASGAGTRLRLRVPLR